LTRVVWRIASDTPSYEADDLTGAGAKLTGGRWNEVGLPVVYASETRALACLETIVHLNAGALPLNRYLVEVSIPDDVWSGARQERAARLPVGWDAEPAGRTSIQLGSDWLRAATSALLVVPSAVVPEEYDILLNPVRPDSSRIVARKVRKWLYDPRLIRRA
jgi:RES domain-containing protein